jgi:hypothetical protein
MTIITEGILIQNMDINVMNTLFSSHCNVHDVPYDSSEYDPQPVRGKDDHVMEYAYVNKIVFLMNLLLDISVMVE